MTQLQDIQRKVGVDPDGAWGPATEEAVAKALGLLPAQDNAPFLAACTTFLRDKEGVRYRAYRDSEGYWTNGCGRLIDPRKGGGYSEAEQAVMLAHDPHRAVKSILEWILTDAEVDMLLSNDINKAVTAMALWPSWKRVQGNVARMVAMTSMCFQLGEKGWAGFTNSLAMIAAGEFGHAADNMLLSKWAKQTPERAKAVTGLMRTGLMP